jgi:hypothetical protein
MEKWVLRLARLARPAADDVFGSIWILISVVGPVAAGAKETSSLCADIAETQQGSESHNRK